MEDKTFKIEDITYRTIMSFEINENKKTYLVYTDDSKDESGSLKISVSIYKKNDKGFDLIPIKSEKEWDMVEEVIEKCLKGNEEV